LQCCSVRGARTPTQASRRLAPARIQSLRSACHPAAGTHAAGLPARGRHAARRPCQQRRRHPPRAAQAAARVPFSLSAALSTEPTGPHMQLLVAMRAPPSQPPTLEGQGVVGVPPRAQGQMPAACASSLANMQIRAAHAPSTRGQSKAQTEGCGHTSRYRSAPQGCCLGQWPPATSRRTSRGCVGSVAGQPVALPVRGALVEGVAGAGAAAACGMGGWARGPPSPCTHGHTRRTRFRSTHTHVMHHGGAENTLSSAGTC
jgi:hypothetical protein